MGVVGSFVLGFTRELVRMYVTAAMASRMVEIKYRNALTKEGLMRGVFDAQSLDLSHLNPDKVSYEPKAIRTEALQVTPENIGKLSLEFEEELFYDMQGRPFFSISAKRFDVDEPDGQQPPSQLTIRLTDWIVPLWDEIHIFRDAVFQHTFTFDHSGHPRHQVVPVSMVRPEDMDFVASAFPGAQVRLVEKNEQQDFNPNDRVYIKTLAKYGIVTVLEVDRHDGRFGIDVKLDSGDYANFLPEELELAPAFTPSTGIIEGPAGTNVMPRVDE